MVEENVWEQINGWESGGYPLIRFLSAAQIDALVYELYGLTDGEVEILEGCMTGNPAE